MNTITPKFTPGPWQSVLVNRHKRGHRIITDDKHVGYSYSDVRKMCVGEEEANARLIAAAPDGYDFASRFEAAVGFLVAGLPANHAVAKDLLGLRDVARAYLAKARGEVTP